MKRFLTIAFVITAIVALVSCQKESSAPSEKLQELHFIVKGHQKPVTKTTLTNNGDGSYTPGWSTGDQLGAFLGTTTITNSTSSVDMTLTNTAAAGATGNFEGSAVASGNGTFQAFYPKSAFAKGYNSGEIGLNVGTTTDYIQHPKVGEPDPSCNILISKACEYESDGSDVVIDDLYFTRPLSILKVNLKGAYANGEEVSSFKLSIPSGALSGRMSINLSSVSISSWTASKSYVWAEYTTSKPVINHSTDNTVYLVINPTTINSGTEVTVEAETDNYSIVKSFTLTSDMSFPANGIAVLNLTIAEGNCTPKTAVYYDLVTTAAAFEDGMSYIFAFKDGSDGHYEFINNSGSSNNVDNATLSVKAGVISNPDEKYIFTAETGSTTGSFKFKNVNNNYIYYSGSSTNLNTNNSSSSDWIPSFLTDSYTYKIQHHNTERYFGYNGSTAVKAYDKDNFKDQVNSGTSLAQFDGAISVFKLRDSRTEPGMYWSAPSASATMTSSGITFTAPTLTLGNASSVTYSSTDENVATINSSGTVSILAEGTTTISAFFAGNTDYTPSIVSYTLTVTDNRSQVSTPTFSPTSGEITKGSTVSITCATSESTIYYTTDGNDPTTSSTQYTTPIVVNGATTIKALAVKENYKTSEVASASYTVIVENTSTEDNPYTVAEAIALAEEMSSSQSLSDVYVYGIINKIDYAYNATNAKISFHISDNGATAGDGLYLFKATATSADQFTVGDWVLMKGTLVNYQGNTPEFSEGANSVTIVKAPTFSPDGGTFTTATQNVTITADAGATIYYTTDGSTPTTSSSVYSSVITVSATTTIKAFAVKNSHATGVVTKVFTKGNSGQKVLTFSLTSNPGGWPTTNSTTLTDYYYILNETSYTFKLYNVKQNSGYLMLTSTAGLGLPAISGYKLTKVVAKNSSSCSTSTRVGISSTAPATATYITGGSYQTWSTTSSTYTYNLSGTSANTVYYLYVTNKNCQLLELTLTYDAVSE